MRVVDRADRSIFGADVVVTWELEGREGKWAEMDERY